MMLTKGKGCNPHIKKSQKTCRCESCCRFDGRTLFKFEGKRGRGAS